MNRVFTTTRLKYFSLLILLVSISIGGYYLYNYYNEEFLEPNIVIVRFKPSVTEEEAMDMLEKYKPGISTRTPRYYDVPSYSFNDSFAGRTIQFSVKGKKQWEHVQAELTKKPIVELTNY